jgi:protein with PEP-CTERM/exosortase system signal
MKNITKWLGASVVLGLLSLATQGAHAITTGPLSMSYTSDSPYLVGTVVPGLQGNGGQAARDAAMTNTLLGMGFHTQARIPFPNGPLYSRTTLPGDGPATITGAVLGTGFGDGTTPISIDLSQTGTFEYLVVAYDGPNGGAAVFDIAGLTGTIEIYRYARPEVVNGVRTGNLLGSNTMRQNYFRITSWTLLNPTAGVPDGGATVMLLGAGLGALGMVRCFIMR